MSNWLGRMRRLAGRDDQKIAAEAERKRVDDAFRACGVVQPKFRAEMAERTTADDAIVLGHVVGACDVPIALRVNEIVGGGHFLTIGSTGCGMKRSNERMRRCSRSIAWPNMINTSALARC